MAGLHINNISFAYADNPVLKDITLDIESGEMVGLLGPNGSGKTTLLKLTSGILSPKQGEIRLDRSNLHRLNRKTVARQMAVVPQQFHIPFAFTVREVVALGRLPYLKPFAEESKGDREAISDALHKTDTSVLEDRFFDELSGGEKQKVILAMALAQQPKILLLDEPTVHLDIGHQLQILETVKELNVKSGLTVIAAIHDLNLASLYFQRLILLKEGSVVADGTPAQVLTADLISNVFKTQVLIERHPATGSPQIIIDNR